MPLILAPWAGGYNASSPNIDILRRLDIIETALNNKGFFDDFSNEETSQLLNDVFSGSVSDNHDDADPDTYSMLADVFSPDYVDDSSYSNPNLQNVFDDVFGF